MSDIKTLIRSAGVDQTADATQAFEQIIAKKIADRLETKKIEVASNIFNKLEEK